MGVITDGGLELGPPGGPAQPDAARVAERQDGRLPIERATGRAVGGPGGRVAARPADFKAVGGQGQLGGLVQVAQADGAPDVLKRMRGGGVESGGRKKKKRGCVSLLPYLSQQDAVFGDGHDPDHVIRISVGAAWQAPRWRGGASTAATVLPTHRWAGFLRSPGRRLQVGRRQQRAALPRLRGLIVGQCFRVQGGGSRGDSGGGGERTGMRRLHFFLLARLASRSVFSSPSPLHRVFAFARTREQHQTPSRAAGWTRAYTPSSSPPPPLVCRELSTTEKEGLPAPALLTRSPSTRVCLLLPPRSTSATSRLYHKLSYGDSDNPSTHVRVLAPGRGRGAFRPGPFQPAAARSPLAVDWLAGPRPRAWQPRQTGAAAPRSARGC